MLPLESDITREKYKESLKKEEYNVVRFIQKFKNYHLNDTTPKAKVGKGKEKEKDEEEAGHRREGGGSGGLDVWDLKKIKEI